MERFLYRLSVSSYSGQFILKGASLFLVWMRQNYRVTRDADLLGVGSPDLQNLAEKFRNICDVDCNTDGMVYHTDTLRVEEIREDLEYAGVRVTLTGLLNQARIPLQLDIGFGDAITPAPEDIEYPTLLEEAPSPKLRAYPRYTVVAEKLEAMVHLGLANSRMKDFYDIWLLSTLFRFKGNVLRAAIKNTFNRRETSLPGGIPFAFTSNFYEDQQKSVQWNAFIKKAGPNVRMNSLPVVIGEILRFLQPVIDSFQSERSFEKEWLPGQGWTEKLFQIFS
ncbi:MAG: nucleotidyl transferase AbiEii/AbiGii toxin family protein [Acidobacteria bacterium]|nr:nucleotidyl transferase AbiEii/AbiGii toxin family protein [Acidobacteriota bacterium]